MKKIYLIFFVWVLVCMCGCSSDGIKGKKIVTACMAEKTEEACRYTFYTPTVHIAESGEEIPGCTYSFTAANFSEAIKAFEKSCGKAELSHLSVFFSDMGYLSDSLSGDIYNIKKELKVSPLIKFYVSGPDSSTVFEKIEYDYDGSAAKMTDAIFGGDNKNLLCTMSEIVFASENTLFTASVPVIELDAKSGYMKNSAAVFHNFYTGNAAMLENDYKVYREFIAANGKTSQSLRFEIVESGIEIKLDSKAPHAAEAAELAMRYNLMGFDILNAVFYSKKCFFDYNSYLEFIGSILPESIKYTGES